MNILLGHLIGDYALQTDWMALNKKSNIAICFIHCLIWSLSVMIATSRYDFWIFLSLFFSHLILDKTYIVREFLKAINKIGYRPIWKKDNSIPMWKIFVVDNTFHLIFAVLILS